LERGERGVDVGHLISDMVQTGALVREKLSYGSVRAERREQLDVVLADVQQHGLDALLPHDLAMGDVQLEQLAVELQRGVDLLDGDADMVDAVEHAAESSGAVRLRPAPCCPRRDAGQERLARAS